MTKRRNAKIHRQSPAPDHGGSGKAASAIRSVSLGERMLQGALVVVIVAGLLFLAMPMGRVPAGSGQRLTDTGSASALSASTSPPPSPTLETTQWGVQVARIDVDALARWCDERGLPDPPRLASTEPEVAQSLFDALVAAANDPSAEHLGRLGMICESLDCHTSAAAYFSLAGRADPSDARWAYYLGCVHQITGRNAEAIAALERAKSLDPDYALTEARLGQLKLEANKHDEARSHFERFVKLAPTDSLGYVGLARVALFEQDSSKAIELLRAALPYGGQDFQVQYYLGVAYRMSGEESLARRHFDLSAELPHGGWFYMRDPLDQALHRSSGSVEALTRELEAISAMQDWPRMAALAERIVARRDRDTKMMLNLATIYSKMGRFEDAITLTDRVEQIEPHVSGIWTTRAIVYIQQRRAEETLAAADKALAIDTENAGAHDLRSRALFLLKRYEESEQAMRSSLALDADSASKHLMMGEIQRVLGKGDEALKHYRKTLELAPHQPTAMQRIAELSVGADGR